MMTRRCVDVKKNWKALRNNSGVTAIKKTKYPTSVYRYTGI